MNLRLCVLDMAGTTVAVTDVVADALRATFREAEIEAPAERIVAARGRSKLEAIADILRASRPDLDRVDALAAELHDSFKLRLLHEIDRGVQPIEGARVTIDWLRGEGVRVALTTGFDRTMTEAILERLGWTTGVADAVLCADDVKAGRPAPDLIFGAMERTGVSDPAHVLVAGDTAADLEAAARAGVGLAVGVLTGAHGRAQLERFAGAVILQSIAELRAHLERVGIS